MINNFIASLPRDIQSAVRITNNKAETDPNKLKRYERVIIPTRIDLDDFYSENKDSINDPGVVEDDDIEYSTRVIYAALSIKRQGFIDISDILMSM